MLLVTRAIEDFAAFLGRSTRVASYFGRAAQGPSELRSAGTRNCFAVASAQDVYATRWHSPVYLELWRFCYARCFVWIQTGAHGLVLTHGRLCTFQAVN